MLRNRGRIYLPQFWKLEEISVSKNIRNNSSAFKEHRWMSKMWFGVREEGWEIKIGAWTSNSVYLAVITRPTPP